MTGRVLLGLLRLPENNFRRQDVMAWLRSAPCSSTALGPDHRGSGCRATPAWSVANPTGTSSSPCSPKRPAPPSSPIRSRRARMASQPRPSQRNTRSCAFVLDLIHTLTRGKRPRVGERGMGTQALIGSLGSVARRRRGLSPNARPPTASRPPLTGCDPRRDRRPCRSRRLHARLRSSSNPTSGVGRFGDGVLVGPITMGIGLTSIS